jgi:hypothetical protein
VSSTSTTSSITGIRSVVADRRSRRVRAIGRGGWYPRRRLERVIANDTIVVVAAVVVHIVVAGIVGGGRRTDSTATSTTEMMEARVEMSGRTGMRHGKCSRGGVGYCNRLGTGRGLKSTSSFGN